jgi:hypothetical protein
MSKSFVTAERHAHYYRIVALAWLRDQAVETDPTNKKEMCNTHLYVFRKAKNPVFYEHVIRGPMFLIAIMHFHRLTYSEDQVTGQLSV